MRRRLLAGAFSVALAAVAACGTTPSGMPNSPSSAEILLQDGERALAIARSNRSVDSYNEAIRYLLPASSERATAQRAGPSLGAAYLEKAAVTGDSEDFRMAVQTFATLADQARGEAKADAQARHAEALMGFYRARIGSQEATDALNTAIAQYEAAVAVKPTAAAHFGLADAYRARGNPGDEALADAALRAGIAAGPVDGTSAQLVQLAAQQERALGAPPQAEADDVVLDTLRRATAAPDASAEAWTALGKRQFDRAVFFGSADFGAARESFNRAATFPNAGGAALAEARYYLSVIDGRAATSRSAINAALENAKSAVRAGGSELRYRRQVCLLTMKRGRLATADEDDDENAIYAEELSDWCEGNTDLPEGRLLSGMALIRQAQYQPAQTVKVRLLTQAGAQFQEGLNLLARGAPASARTVQWPGDMAQPVPVQDLLNFGDGVVVEQCANPRPDPAPQPIGPLTTRQIGEIFDRYEAFACRL